MSRILITGAAGLLGQNLADVLSNAHEILAVDIAINPYSHIAQLEYCQADLTDFAAVRECLMKFAPEYIFNCAALTDVDRCETEKELADKLNFELVNHLLTLPTARIIHYSSDYVFDGKSGPYSEDDQPDPMNYYGITKLHSENILLNSGIDHLIIRTNVLFGEARAVRKNFVQWVRESLKAGEKIAVVDDQSNNPISAINLARASVEAALSSITGVLHIAGDEYLSRYQFARRIAEYYKLDSSRLHQVKTSEINQLARRPILGGLKINKAKKLLKEKLLDIRGGLSQLENKK